MSKASQLYIISEGENGPIKIGRSTNPFVRLASIQTGNPRPLHIFALWELGDADVTEAESELHWLLEEFALEGEWFALDEKFISEYMPDYFLSNGFEPGPI